jgi:hypothetical protein
MTQISGPRYRDHQGRPRVSPGRSLSESEPPLAGSPGFRLPREVEKASYDLPHSQSNHARFLPFFSYEIDGSNKGPIGDPRGRIKAPRTALPIKTLDSPFFTREKKGNERSSARTWGGYPPGEVGTICVALRLPRGPSGLGTVIRTHLEKPEQPNDSTLPLPGGEIRLGLPLCERVLQAKENPSRNRDSPLHFEEKGERIKGKPPSLSRKCNRGPAIGTTAAL